VFLLFNFHKKKHKTLIYRRLQDLRTYANIIAPKTINRYGLILSWKEQQAHPMWKLGKEIATGQGILLTIQKRWLKKYWK